MDLNVNTYLHSDFARSTYCRGLTVHLHVGVKQRMIYLLGTNPQSELIVRACAPLVGATTLCLSLSLRVASVIEPLIGIIADFLVTIIFCSSKPLKNIPFRCCHLFYNLAYALKLIVFDVVKLGIVVSMGAIFYPKPIFKHLSEFS